MARTQDALPGVETPEIAELETAAHEVWELQEKRMSLAKRETDARRTLAGLLQEHKRHQYRMQDGRVAELVKGETKAFVRKPKKRRAKKGK